MANPERIQITNNKYGEPLEMCIDPRSINRAGLKAIAKKLMDQVIQYGNNVAINIHLPRVNEPIGFGREDFLKASREEKEEQTLDNLSYLMLGAEKVTIRKHNLNTKYYFSQEEEADVFKNFIENEMKAEF